MMCNRDAVDFSRRLFLKRNASVLNECYNYVEAQLARPSQAVVPLVAPLLPVDLAGAAGLTHWQSQRQPRGNRMPSIRLSFHCRVTEI
jgi:hypothetical protein